MKSWSEWRAQRMAAQRDSFGRAVVRLVASQSPVAPVHRRPPAFPARSRALTARLSCRAVRVRNATGARLGSQHGHGQAPRARLTADRPPPPRVRPHDVPPCRAPMAQKSALITGITGQDGSYLAELLLDRGYEVHGMVRRASTEKFERIEHIRDRIPLHQGDLLDQPSLVDALRAARPDEIYNLAAMSFVAVSWIQPTLTAEFTGVGV